MPATPSNDDGPGEWIALPGLFAQSELVESSELEVRALPLLLVSGRIYFGVYVRERTQAARAGTASRSAA